MAAAALRDVPPGVIVFAHEESGSVDPAQHYDNLRWMDARDPNQPSVPITNFTAPSAGLPGAVADTPIWSKDYSQLAFGSNYSNGINGLASLESTHSIYGINADSSGFRQITGGGLVAPLPSSPSGSITGSVVSDPPGGAVDTNTCQIAVQGAPQVVGCNADGTFRVDNVPVGSHWVRVLASVSYPATPGEPGLSIGSGAIGVIAGQTTSANNGNPISLSPQFAKSLEPSWSRDGTRLLVTRELSGKLPPAWAQYRSDQVYMVSSADGAVVQAIPFPYGTAASVGADWSPVVGPSGADRICFIAQGSGQSAIYMADSTGQNATPIFLAPYRSTGQTFLRICRWSPDGTRIAFVLQEVPIYGAQWSDLYLVNADGTGLVQLTHNPPGSFVNWPSWSPDGQAIAYDLTVNGSPPTADLFAINVNTSAIVQLTNDGRSFNPAWAPNPFYFAEGYTGSGFSETLSLLVPKHSGVASIVYYTQSGPPLTKVVPLTEGKVTVEDVNADVGQNQQVSAKVMLSTPGVVERTIHFNSGQWHGSTDNVGVPAPSIEWDFAEGSTYPFFSEYLTLQNPTGSRVVATLNYFTDAGLTPSKTLGLPAHSRTTVEVFKGDTSNVANCIPNGTGANCGVGPGIGGVSVQVKSDSLPIIAERPFYVNGFSFGDGVIRDGHDAFGAPAPGVTWNFAEGTTLGGFKEYLTLHNPGTADAVVALNYFTDTGAHPVKTVTVPAHTRVTVEVFKGDTTTPVPNCIANGPGANCGVGPNVGGVSVQVVSTQPIVAERPMYMVVDFGSGPVAGAHDVVGATGLGELFGFAAASTAIGENDYLTIQNPGATTANLTVFYLANSGQIQKLFQVPAGTRHTVEMFKTAEGPGPGYTPLGIVLLSDQPVLVEKPTYSSNPSTYGATDTLGYSPPHF